ncbi:MAG: acyl-CoA thioesterase [Pirellulaceae bacterium]|nr:acyl-CoA thioesterase [Pirellulaceae bacterium]
MHTIYLHQHVVRPDEIDGLGHANNIAYLAWMQDAAIAHSTANGWSMQRHLDEGLGWVVRSHRIEYKRPAFAGDEIVVETWVSGFRSASSTRRYNIYRAEGGQLLARGETCWVFVDLTTGKPRAVPETVLQSFTVAESV